MASSCREFTADVITQQLHYPLFYLLILLRGRHSTDSQNGKCCNIGEKSRRKLLDTNESLWHQHGIDNVNHTITTLDVRMNNLRVIYLKASVKQTMNFYGKQSFLDCLQ